MRIRLLLLLIVLCQLISGCRRTRPSAEEQRDATEQYSAIQMLSDFYKSYITENLEEGTDKNKVERILKEYVSKKLRTKLSNLELDYDPFVNAQDYSKDWIEKMRILKVDTAENAYAVCLSDDYHYVILDVSKRKNKYKINNILFPDIATANSVTKEDSSPTIKGKWQTICRDDEESLEFINSSYADLNIYTQSGESAYVLLSVNDDEEELQLKYQGLSAITRGNSDLNWFDFSIDSVIAEVKVINQNHITIDWMGFYNFKTGKREFVNNPFDKNSSIATLKKCE
ncbi:DUF3828 domain-containing protein [Bacteroides sp.]|mgnify:CR=1 FL=1|uniref:DUF3828 domain-containing protein n=1 Tax=Bacteroides sp. TaxID=29523 RepID=UPI003AB400B9